MRLCRRVNRVELVSSPCEVQSDGTSKSYGVLLIDIYPTIAPQPNVNTVSFSSFSVRQATKIRADIA